ncbi:hypothetical protein EW146_g1693 [Bondarzewia mesenterica]|uniref:Cerato-platanin n=1 Tax=Bondarzewia mesenterica TaxID=1095465 RepID=A0A4S4M3F8_9AGAM|nr:hypothetical protein EW146_g1693 [Bondarzewia mesenterica]
MKFITALVAAVSFSTLALADTIRYDDNYGNSGNSLTSVACSDGTNGLITRGFSTFGSLPSFPYIGASSAVAGWNSPNCGTCWAITYNGKTINVLAIDHAADGFNLSLDAMNDLTNGQAVALGTVQATVSQVAASQCGL